MRLILFILFLIVSSVTLAQIQSSCDVGKDKYICSDNVIIETKSTIPGKWRFSGQSAGTIIDPTNKITTITGISAPIVKVYWVNNDQSCADTLEIIQPKIGSTTLQKNGNQVSGNELTLCYGDNWVANTPVTQGKSFVAYVLYKSKPPVNPNVYTDKEAFAGTVVCVNNDINNGNIKNTYPNNSNEYWFVPVLYNETGFSGPIIDSNCQITGTPFKINYLDKIQISKLEDCMLGSVDLTVVGGTKNYDVKNFLPSTLLIDSLNITSGKLHLSNIIVNQRYSINLNDDNGCIVQYATKFSPCPACKTDVIYQKTYCVYDSFPAPALKQGAGIGILQLVPATEKGLVFDSITGRLNIQASKPGQYIIRNKTSLSCLKSDSTDFNIEILDSIPVPKGSSIDTLCMPNPKIGDIQNISAQLITWYNKSGDKLDPAIDPAIHGTTYYCTQTIKGCESDKKTVKIFAPTVSPPKGDSILYLCNKKTAIAGDVLFPQESTIFWYNNLGKKIKSEDQISQGYYWASQFLGCESRNKLKVHVKEQNVIFPTQVADSFFFCQSQFPKVVDITGTKSQYFLFDVPNAKSYLENYKLLEQGLYYLSYRDTVSNCVTDRKKVWVNLPTFDVQFEIDQPYCGFQNGTIKFVRNDFSESYRYFLASKEVDSIVNALKAGEHIIKIIENSKSHCQLDTILTISCKKSDLQEILTPNLDGKNDVLVFGLSSAYPKSKLFVYNRWGNLVFESTIPYVDNWTGNDNVGNPLPSGTYYYVIEKERNQILKNGFVELLK